MRTNKNSWPDLDHNCLTLMVFLKELLKKFIKHAKLPAQAELSECSIRLSIPNIFNSLHVA